MSGVTDLARHIKARDNPSSYTPMFGRIISLPKLVIQLGNNILLDDSDIKSVFDIYETQEEGQSYGIQIPRKRSSFIAV